MNEILKKLLSRKFIAAVAGFAVGAGMALGGLDGNIIASCAGAAMSCISVGAYIITEGRIDAAAVKAALENVQEAGEAIINSDKGGSVTDPKALPEVSE